MTRLVIVKNRFTIERLEQPLLENHNGERLDRLIPDYIEHEIRKYRELTKRLSKRHILSISVNKE